MTVGDEMQLGPDYLRLQADRCQRLSRSCMDLGTARDLRLMSEEYYEEASRNRSRDVNAAKIVSGLATGGRNYTNVIGVSFCSTLFNRASSVVRIYPSACAAFNGSDSAAREQPRTWFCAGMMKRS